MSKSLKSLSDDELSLELDESSEELSLAVFGATGAGLTGCSSSDDDSDSEEEDEELESLDESLCCLLRR